MLPQREIARQMKAKQTAEDAAAARSTAARPRTRPAARPRKADIQPGKRRLFRGPRLRNVQMTQRTYIIIIIQPAFLLLPAPRQMASRGGRCRRRVLSNDLFDPSRGVRRAPAPKSHQSLRAHADAPAHSHARVRCSRIGDQELAELVVKRWAAHRLPLPAATCLLVPRDRGVPSLSLSLARARVPQVLGCTWVYHSMAALRRRQPSLITDYDAGARRRARPQPRNAS